ncbi:DNA cytosine methyltransferase [Escherichia coli]
MTEHVILDMCCGSRMFWLDKADPRAVFCDIRAEEHVLCDERRLVISPDVIADFRAQQTLAFLREYCGEDCDGLVTIDGITYHIVDIGMRMLQPHELYRAQGFPEWYIIDRDYRGVKYAKDKQVARCGNAVPPPFAEALVRANLPEMCRSKQIAA